MGRWLGRAGRADLRRQPGGGGAGAAGRVGHTGRGGWEGRAGDGTAHEVGVGGDDINTVSDRKSVV